MWYRDSQLRKKLNLRMLLETNENILCKNQIMQNLSLQFKYVQLHISDNTTEVKLLRF